MVISAGIEPIDRFKGAGAKRTLVNAFLQQSIVNGVHDLAVALAEAVRLQQFQPGEVLIEQGQADNDLMFVLLGEVSIHVNGNELARRSAGADAEQVELLQLDGKSIHVAEYLTELPPVDVLRERLHRAIAYARERVAALPAPEGGEA